MCRHKISKNETNRFRTTKFIIFSTRSIEFVFAKLLSRRIFEYEFELKSHSILHHPIFLHVSISWKAAISRQRLRMRNHVPAETAKNLPPIPKRIFLNPDQQNHRHPSTTNTALLNFLKTCHYVNLQFAKSIFSTKLSDQFEEIVKESRKLEEKLSFVT